MSTLYLIDSCFCAALCASLWAPRLEKNCKMLSNTWFIYLLINSTQFCSKLVYSIYLQSENSFIKERRPGMPEVHSLAVTRRVVTRLGVGRGNALLTRVHANSSPDNPASVSRWSIRLLRVALAMCSLQMPKFQYFGNFLILFYYQFIANVFKIYKHTIICTIYFRKQFTVTTRAISCKF